MALVPVPSAARREHSGAVRLIQRLVSSFTHSNPRLRRPDRARRGGGFSRGAATAVTVAAVVTGLTGPPTPTAGAEPVGIEWRSARSIVPAQVDPTPPTVPGDSVALASISPALAGVEVDSIGFRRANTLYVFVRSELADVRHTRETADADLVNLAAEESRLASSLQEATARKKEEAVALAAIRERRRQLAVAGYLGGQAASTPVAALSLDANTAARQKGLLVRGLDETSAEDQADAEAGFRAAVALIDRARSGHESIKAEVERTTAIRDQAAAGEAQLSGELAQRRADLDQARALSTVVGTDFTLVAMDAYYKAAIGIAATDPECGVPWWAMAGIGRVESHHGTYGGTELRANGDTATPIIGIPLDGTNDTTVVADTDGGLLDGDTEVDRAVGPMQFIPSTWVRYARDGNGDGRRDPHNMYDAVRAAADYLCKSAPLTDDEGLSRAYYRYNHSDAYVRSVVAWAHRYETTAIPPPPVEP